MEIARTDSKQWTEWLSHT